MSFARSGRLGRGFLVSAAALVWVLAALAVDPGGALALTWGAGVKAMLPAGAGSNPGVALNSVSCASAGNCSAVGDYRDNSGGLQGVLLTETGGNWARGVQAILPANAAPKPGVALGDVSCGSAGNCSAVGRYTDSSGHRQGLLLTETGGKWTRGVEATLPAGKNSNPFVRLGSVSCASAGNCSAVGSYVDRSPAWQGLLLTETAGRWARGVKAILPAGAAKNPYADVGPVSCASAGNCSAVGSYGFSGGRDGLLLTETGGKWAAGVKATLPAGAASNPDAEMEGVSCASAGSCTAVGNYTDSSNSTRGFLLTESAGSWAAGVKASPPTGGVSAVDAVSCASVGNCAAVGYYGTPQEGLLLTETGGSWGTGVKAIPPPGANSTNPYAVLFSVSCPSVGNCGAVGSYTDSSYNDQGLLLSETGGTWAAGVEATPPAGAASKPQVVLSTVSCASATSCNAVGSYRDSSGHRQGALFATKPS